MSESPTNDAARAMEGVWCVSTSCARCNHEYTSKVTLATGLGGVSGVDTLDGSWSGMLGDDGTTCSFRIARANGSVEEWTGAIATGEVRGTWKDVVPQRGYEVMRQILARKTGVTIPPESAAFLCYGTFRMWRQGQDEEALSEAAEVPATMEVQPR